MSNPFKNNSKRETKYNNHKVEINGIKFDSKKEASRYIILKDYENRGMIRDLCLQSKFILQDEFNHNGKRFLPITYLADFTYLRADGKVCEDVKSEATKKNPVYRIKKKMFIKRYGDDWIFLET